MKTPLFASTSVARTEGANTSIASDERFPSRIFLAFATVLTLGVLLAMTLSSTNVSAANDTGSDKKTVAALDTQYQAAVKKNDAATMDRILADDFVLVTGSGKTYNKADLLKDARSGQEVYEHNEDTEQTARVWGDTAVLTAKLWEKGTDSGKPFDHTVWFSDTYVRTPAGWRYVFGQSSLPLPKASK